MNKPTKHNIFFSHSSKDADFVGKIRSHIIEKTGASFDIFQSSDGSSIRLGTNWLKKIEDALESCTIMFVFITKNSMSSPWIYFESGHAYSRKIQVIPIACMGCTMEDLRPPLTFLQGFNLNTSESFENIMAEINKALDLNFKSVFQDFQNYDDSVYAKIKNDDLDFIDLFSHDFYIGKAENIKADYWDNLFTFLKNKWGSARTTENGNEVIFSKRCKFIEHKNANGNGFIRIEIDPWVIDDLFMEFSNILDSIYNKYGSGPDARFGAVAYFNETIKVPRDVHHLSGRLPDDVFTKDATHTHSTFWYKNIGFHINDVSGSRKQMPTFIFYSKYQSEGPFPVREAIRELRRNKII